MTAKQRRAVARRGRLHALATALLVTLLLAPSAWAQRPPHVPAPRPAHVPARPAPPRAYRPAPTPGPPHVYRPAPRRRVVVHEHRVYPAPVARPRQTIVDPRSSFYLGIGPVAHLIVEGDSQLSKSIENGGGLELFAGFRVNRWVAFEFGGLFSFHEPAVRSVTNNGVMNGVTGDAKIFFLPGSRRIEPFVQLGAGLYLFSRDGWDGNSLTGGGFQLGGGVDIRLSRMFAIGTRVLYRGIYMDNSDAAFWGGVAYQSAFLNSFTLSANVQIHF